MGAEHNLPSLENIVMDPPDQQVFRRAGHFVSSLLTIRFVMVSLVIICNYMLTRN